MITTNDLGRFRSMWAYKDHGKSYEKMLNPPSSRTEFRWVHDSFGTNWRMTEMQAAIGRIQLKKLDGWVKKRRRNAQILREHLQDLSGIRIPIVPPECYHSYYKFYAFLADFRVSRSSVLNALQALEVPCYPGSCSEVYREQAFQGTPLVPRHPLPNAKKLGETSLMFLVHPTLTEAEMHQMGETIRKALKTLK